MNAQSPALVARPDRLRLVGQRRQVLAIMHQRLMVGMLVYGGIIALIVLRLLYLGVFGDHAGRKQLFSALTPARADIVDRDGNALARTIDAWSIALHPKKIIGNKLDLARKLAVIMPEHDEVYYYDLMRSSKPFIYLRRRAAPGVVEAINGLGEPGLALDREPDRLYPQMNLGSTMLGFTDVDGHGTSGAERAFDKQLSNPGPRHEPVTLSISSKVQQALEHELNASMNKFHAIGAAGVIMDVNTHEVLAISSLPDFNANAPGNVGPDQLFNRATMGVYELGSTFKPFTVAMAMDSGIVKSMGQMYSCPMEYPIYGHVIHDTHPFGRPCSVADIMRESSNIGTAQIADKLGRERQQAFLKKLGFLDKVEFELGERGHPLLPTNWGPFEVLNVGFGQGIAITPLQLANGYATLYNGGIYRPATLLKVDRNHPLPAGRRVFTEDTSYKMRSLLRLVAMKGTGKNADAPGYRVGGKTGTAQKVIGGRYSKTINITSFAAVFPMDEPRYVVVVMLDEPKVIPETMGYNTAGWNAAPMVKTIISRIAPMLGVRPNKQREPNMEEVLPYIIEKTGK